MKIGDILLSNNIISKQELELALKIKKMYPDRLLGEILKSLYFVTSVDIAKTLAVQAKKEYIDLKSVYPDYQILKMLSKDVCIQFKMLPLYISNNKILVAIDDPYNIVAIDFLKRKFNKDIEVLISDTESILKYIQTHYYNIENPFEKQYEELLKGLKENPNRELPKVVNFIIEHSIIRRASDIHISPQYLATDVFIRVDGVLKHLLSLPREIHQGLSSRIKILADLNIAEQRIPQDGAFSYSFLGYDFDMRVSTVPSSYGENIVIRILNKDVSFLSIYNLGFLDEQLKLIEKNVNKTQGIFLVTGPTGSGKTTTLYSMLRKVNYLEKNVLTVEDPVEYKFPFIKQTQVNEKIGYTFASAIRSFLRQDPDVILVGEIRDEETARMSIKAALTGHLVLSTLHANSAVTAIPRMADLGIQNYLIASSFNAVLSQRLFRVLCPVCKEKHNISKDELIELGYKVSDIETLGLKDEIEIYRPKGCKNCNYSGFVGRKVISEIFEFDDVVSSMIEFGEPITKINQYLVSIGFKNLRQVGLINVLSGITSPEEIMRVVG